VETRDIAGDSLPPTVVRLGWVSFLTDVSSEMILPLLPAFLATTLGAPASALGWIEGVAETTASFVKIASGRLTDRAPAKKPLVLLGYGLSSLVRPLIGLATIWPVVLALRFVDRIGKGIRTAPRDTLIAAAVPLERRGAAFGLHRAFDNAGAVLGPLLASLLVVAFGFSMKTVFLLSIVPGALSFLVLVTGVPETAAPPAPEGTGTVAPLPGAFWRVAGVLTFFTLAASSDTFILLRARELGAPPAALPLLWSMSHAVRSAFGRLGGGLSDRFGRKRLILVGWALYAICYAAFGAVRSLGALVAVLAVYSLYAPLTEGAEKALAADLVPAASRGRAFGWLSGMTGLAALPASVLFGTLWQHAGAGTAFLTGAAIAGVATALLSILEVRPASG